jgi:hypothetical protein
VSASSILAGVGVVAHHAMPAPPRDEPGVARWDVDDVLEVLGNVNWSKLGPDDPGDQTSHGDGVAGKLASSGSFSVGGPKEVGYAVGAAVEDPTSTSGKKIRA